MLGYYAKTKFSNGQTGIIVFWKECLNEVIEWNVSFAINNKRKRIKAWLENEESMDIATGKCGLEGLIWAKNSLLAFEDFIKSDFFNQRIAISWSDNRRKRIYKRYLTKEGYRFIIHYGKEFLIKDI